MRGWVKQLLAKPKLSPEGVPMGTRCSARVKNLFTSVQHRQCENPARVKRHGQFYCYLHDAQWKAAKQLLRKGRAA